MHKHATAAENALKENTPETPTHRGGEVFLRICVDPPPHPSPQLRSGSANPKRRQILTQRRRSVSVCIT